MTPEIKKKWRPTLAMIIIPVLLAVFAMPIALIVWFRAPSWIYESMSGLAILSFLAVGGATLVFGYVFNRTLTGPINHLIVWAESLGKGDRESLTVPEKQGTREIAVLSQSFLDLATRLLDQSDYVRSFADHVSHELKSPLTAIHGAAELILDTRMSVAERNKFLRQIVDDTTRLATLLDRLRELAQAEQPPQSGTTTLAGIREHLALTKSEIEMDLAGITQKPLAISLEAATIIFSQLADNAYEHKAKKLTVSAVAEGDQAIITIADDGTGISLANIANVFQPFFTTKREEGGTGMGLRIVRTMLEAHGGTITLLPVREGTQFQITLPFSYDQPR